MLAWFTRADGTQRPLYPARAHAYAALSYAAMVAADTRAAARGYPAEDFRHVARALAAQVLADRRIAYCCALGRSPGELTRDGFIAATPDPAPAQSMLRNYPRSV